MQFGMLDPRSLPAAAEANALVLGPNTLGIEVTVPALAAQCGLGNLDPQHIGGNADLTAIEVALTAELPADDATLATVRADLDSVGAMAMIALRVEMKNRIKMVAAADKFARGGYPGPKALPSQANPWPEESTSAESSRPLAAIAAAVSDFKVSMADRVATMVKWLLTGEEPEQYRAQVEKERAEMIAALESGAIKHETRANGRIAAVESTHRAATMVGYALAPVVVALNPTFKAGPGEPYKKFTICAFEANKFANIQAAIAELAELEAGWGGSPTIGGSPQGVSSTLTIDQVVAVVEKHLK